MVLRVCCHELHDWGGSGRRMGEVEGEGERRARLKMSCVSFFLSFFISRRRPAYSNTFRFVVSDLYKHYTIISFFFEKGFNRISSILCTPMCIHRYLHITLRKYMRTFIFPLINRRIFQSSSSSRNKLQ